MSEPTSGRKPKKDEVVEDAVVVEESPAAADPEPVRAETVEVVETAEPAPAPHVVYVQAPPPPARKGNRGIGALIALLSAVVFIAALAIVSAFISLATGRGFSFGVLANPQFYWPALFYVIGFVLLVLLANRAAWWAYIFGSIIVALVVYFGTIGAVLLAGGVILRTPEEAAAMFESGLTNPLVIAAALLAREVSLWTGSIIARRGRSVKARNVEARAAWEREVAEQKAQYERAAAGGSTAV